MKISFKDIENRIAELFGFLGTIPIIYIGGLTIFSWLTFFTFFIFIFVLFWKRRGFTKFCIPYFVMALLSVVTAIVCKNSSIPDVWKEKQVSGVVWNFLYLSIIIYYSSKNRTDLPRYFIKGVYYSSIVHMVWGYLQFILYRSSGIKLNDLVFVNLLHMSKDSLTQIKSGNIAISGLCSNAGNMAPLLLVGYALSSSIFLKVMFILCTLLSGSRVCIITMFSFILISYIVKPDKSPKAKRMALSVVGVVLAGVVFLIFSGKMGDLYEAISITLGYFSKETLANQSSAIIHLRYWTSLFDVSKFAGLWRVLFGFGMGCSGYPFDHLYYQYAALNIGAWSVETDYINQLWNLGLISFIVRYIWYGRYIKVSFHNDKKTFCFLIAILIGGIFYNITFNWVFILLCSLFILLKNKEGNESVLSISREKDNRRLKNVN